VNQNATYRPGPSNEVCCLVSQVGCCVRMRKCQAPIGS
jgi:hypothetical protein